MNRRSLLTGLAALIGGACAPKAKPHLEAYPVTHLPSPTLHSISGTVVVVGRQIDDEPLSGATVLLESVETHESGFPIEYTEGMIETGSNGRFWFPGVAPGNYRLKLFYQGSEEDTVNIFGLDKSVQINLQVRW